MASKSLSGSTAPLREPINTLVGKYEASLVREGSSDKTVRWMDEALCDFFRDHPRVSRPAQILITDVEDWKNARLERGDNYNVVRAALCALSGFYGWLIEEGLAEVRPVVIPPYRPKPLSRPDLVAQNQVLALQPGLHPAGDGEQTDPYPSPSE